MSRFACVVVLCSLTASLAAQQPPPRFEVASVKRSPDPATTIVTIAVGVTQPGGVWRSTFATVQALIRSLYPDHGFPGQIEGGPNWVGSEFYDINARALPSSSPDDMRAMARTLLAERFKLAMHTEMRDVPAYGLVTARADRKLGRGLTKPAVDCDLYRAAKERGEPLPTDPTRKQYADRLPCTATVMPVFDQTRLIPNAQMRLTAGGATIANIVQLLARVLERPVVDRTGLSQTFDIEVQFSTGPPRPDAETGPPLKVALEDQLGLTIEEGRAVIEVLVIDSVDRPTPD
jgi:uncharacterized protein (TIGR03435 family)